MRVSYLRCSTVEQSFGRQEEILKRFEIEKTFREKISGKDRNRPKLEEMLDFVREGDEIYISEFSRIARSTKDLLSIIEEIQSKGCKLVSAKENLDTSTATGKLMVTMIAAVNEFELAQLHERQAVGIALAKAKGVYRGRKKVQIEDFEEHYNRLRNKEVSKVNLAKELGISRVTLDKLIREHEGTLNEQAS